MYTCHQAKFSKKKKHVVCDLFLSRKQPGYCRSCRLRGRREGGGGGDEGVSSSSTFSESSSRMLRASAIISCTDRLGGDGSGSVLLGSTALEKSASSNGLTWLCLRTRANLGSASSLPVAAVLWWVILGLRCLGRHQLLDLPVLDEMREWVYNVCMLRRRGFMNVVILC